MELFHSYKNENFDFLNEIKELAQKNPTLSKGINTYGSIDTIFNDFSVTKWGNGAIEGDSLRESDKSIMNATNYIPDVETYIDTVNEWRSRKEKILHELSTFEGSGDEAQEMIERLHKDYSLVPLNTKPIMQKL